MIELMLNTGLDVPTGDNPTYGTRQAGYYGQVTEEDFISADALAQSIGLTTGTVETAVKPSWICIALNGKKMYYATRAFRRAITWDSIYNRGATFDPDNSPKPPHLSVIDQNAEVTINGLRYRVRQMTMTEWADVIIPLGSTWVPSLVSQMNIGNVNGAARWTSTPGASASYRQWRGWGSIGNSNATGTATNTAPTSSGWSPLLEPLD